jgi:uncharacterized protein (TIGR03067 family)
MRLPELLTLAAGAVLLADVPGQDVTKDQERLQGTWVLVGRELDGKASTEEEVKRIEGKIVVSGNKITYGSRGEVDGQESTFKLDPAAKPRAIDWTITSGPVKGAKVRAIYKLEGDRLTVCSGGGEKRPTEFSTKPRDEQVLLVYRRQKK